MPPVIAETFQDPKIGSYLCTVTHMFSDYCLTVKTIINKKGIVLKLILC